MKRILFILMLVPAFCFGQKIETAAAGDKIKVEVSQSYLVQRDTLPSLDPNAKVVQITLTPIVSVRPELESKLGGVLGRLSDIDIQIQALQDEKKGLNQQKKELENLISKLSPAPPK